MDIMIEDECNIAEAIMAWADERCIHYKNINKYLNDSLKEKLRGHLNPISENPVEYQMDLYGVLGDYV